MNEVDERDSILRPLHFVFDFNARLFKVVLVSPRPSV